MDTRKLDRGGLYAAWTLPGDSGTVVKVYGLQRFTLQATAACTVQATLDGTNWFDAWSPTGAQTTQLTGPYLAIRVNGSSGTLRLLGIASY